MLDRDSKSVEKKERGLASENSPEAKKPSVQKLSNELNEVTPFVASPNNLVPPPPPHVAQAEGALAHSAEFTPLNVELGLDPIHVHDFEGQDFVCLILDRRINDDARAKIKESSWRMGLLLDAYREMAGLGRDEDLATAASDFMTDLLHHMEEHHEGGAEEGMATGVYSVMDRAWEAFHSEEREARALELLAGVEPGDAKETPDEGAKAHKFYFDEDISRISTSDWSMDDDGLTETRHHLGKSDDGYHYAVETSYRGGDSGDLGWSIPYPTLEEASRAMWNEEREAAELD